MAIHQYTFLKLQQQAQHATGKDRPDATTLTAAGASDDTWQDVVNECVLEFAQLRPWAWRQEPLSLDLTNAQSYVNLPTDFGQILTLKRNSTLYSATPKSLSQILMYRAGAFSQIGVTGILYAYSAKKQASATALPTHRLEIFPTPTAAETGALVGIYLRLPAAMSSDSDLPDAPAHCHPAILQFVRYRACARHAPDKAKPERDLFQDLYQPLAAEDAGMQCDLGDMEGWAMPSPGCEDADSAWLYPTSIS